MQQQMTEDAFQFTSAAISDRGLSEKRPQNEDSFIELKDYGFFVVADGVGGAQAGDVASQMAVEILGEAFVNFPPDADSEDLMKIAIERANSAIYQMARDLPQLSSMATTIVALYIDGEIATIGHVGDSRLYRLDANGQLYRETQDHSVVEEEVRAGRMTPDQALTHPSRNVINRAVGADESVEIDMKVLRISPGSIFLLCSDGITRHIEDWEIAALMGSEQAPAQMCQQMKEICYSRGAEDNLTAVIVQFPAPTSDYSATAAQDNEAEQVTVAAARPNSTQTEEVQDIQVESSEDKTQEFALETEPPAEDNDDQGYLIEDASELYTGETVPNINEAYTSSSVTVPAQERTNISDYSREQTTGDTATGSSLAIMALSALALLLIGGLLGYGAQYLLNPAVPAMPVEAPPQLIAKSPDIPLTAFEESRRLVDKDPAGFITANASSLRDSEDYFLMGRAFLLTGRGWEAKRSFNEAKNRLAQADPANAKTLAAEIAMALTIIETPRAIEYFEKALAADNSGVIPNANTPPNSNTVANTVSETNTNTAVNANQPVR